MKHFLTPLTAVATLLTLTACADLTQLNDDLYREEAQIAEKTPTQKLLEKLPAAQEPVVLSVYEFLDQTGAQKPNDNFADFSHAVTQGGVNMLYKALMDAGKGKWFTVIERAGLKNLQAERQLINATRQDFAQQTGQRMAPVPPLLYAGVILEGGIVAYDSNTLTGGAGAGYLGISANTQYRRDMVTIYLRAISVQNGEVLASVNTSKTIYSTVVTANIFKYVSYDEILEGETGYSVNEPPQLAVRQAIEYGVYSLVMEGASKGLWGFSNPSAAKDQMRAYMKARDGAEPSNTVLNNALGIQPEVAAAPAVPVQMQEEARKPSLPANRYAVEPTVHQSQSGNLDVDIYATPKSSGPQVKPRQMPKDAQFVEPALGETPAEAKVAAPRNEPQPQFFTVPDSNTQYTVKCTAQGCAPITAAQTNSSINQTKAATPPPPTISR